MFFLVVGDPKTLDLIRLLFTSSQDLLHEYFDAEFLKAPLARLSSELSVPPSPKNSAIGGLMMALRHNPGVARPKGGSGALTAALVRLVTELGGQILTEQPVGSSHNVHCPRKIVDQQSSHWQKTVLGNLLRLKATPHSVEVTP